MKRFLFRAAVGGLLAGLLVSGPTWGQMAEKKAQAAPTAPATAKVNINTADAAGLATLKGIGEKKAQAIIEYREKHGPFKSVDDLAHVDGIGEKTVSSLKDQITVE